jgi:hypothetical protein
MMDGWMDGLIFNRHVVVGKPPQVQHSERGRDIDRPKFLVTSRGLLGGSVRC